MKVTFIVDATAACFEAFRQKMVETKEGDYYNTPAGFRMLPRDRDGRKEDFYVENRGEYAGFSTERRCGYTIAPKAVVYIGCVGNMCWVRLIAADKAEVGYWGARHGCNLNRLLEMEQYDRLTGMVPALYETSEPDWRWNETLDNHPEDPRHRSHWPEETA